MDGIMKMKKIMNYKYELHILILEIINIIIKIIFFIIIIYMEPSNEYKSYFRRTYGQYDPHGFDLYGYDEEGYDWRGYNSRGYDRGGRHISKSESVQEKLSRLWREKYGEGGFNEDGYNIDGFDEYGMSKANYILEEQIKEREELERQQREADAVLAREYKLSSTPLNMNVNRMARGSTRRNRGRSKGLGVTGLSNNEDNNRAARSLQGIELQPGNRQGPDGDWYRQGMNGMWHDLNDGGVSYYSVWPGEKARSMSRESRGRGTGARGSPGNGSSPGGAATRKSHGKGVQGKGPTHGKGVQGKGPNHGKGVQGKGPHHGKGLQGKGPNHGKGPRHGKGVHGKGG